MGLTGLKKKQGVKEQKGLAWWLKSWVWLAPTTFFPKKRKGGGEPSPDTNILQLCLSEAKQAADFLSELLGFGEIAIQS